MQPFLQAPHIIIILEFATTTRLVKNVSLPQCLCRPNFSCHRYSRSSPAVTPVGTFPAVLLLEPFCSSIYTLNPSWSEIFTFLPPHQASLPVIILTILSPDLYPIPTPRAFPCHQCLDLVRISPSVDSL